MIMPGFTAEAAVSDLRMHRGYIGSADAAFDAQVLAPQFGGGQFCYWRCYPGSGCEHVCQFFPY